MSGRISEQVSLALREYAGGVTDVYHLARTYGVSHSTLYRAIRRQPIKHEPPKVLVATVRDGVDEWHLECRMSDGQKGAFVTVDYDHEELAHLIANFLSARKK